MASILTDICLQTLGKSFMWSLSSYSCYVQLYLMYTLFYLIAIQQMLINSATSVCLSQARTWISIMSCFYVL